MSSFSFASPSRVSSSSVPRASFDQSAGSPNRKRSSTLCWYESAAAKSELPSVLCGVRARLQDKLGAVDFPVPRLVLVGGQGAGKSRLVECLAGEQFNFCAGSRRPTVLEFRNVEQAKEPRWYVREREGASWEPCPPAEVRRVVANAHASLGGSVSAEPVSVQVESDACVDMQIIDLPGYCSSAAPDAAESAAAAQIERVNSRYLWDPSNVILCVEEAGDAADLASLKRAQECDPECKRTLLIRTKFDRYCHNLTSVSVNKWLEGYGTLPTSLPKFAMTLPAAATAAASEVGAPARDQRHTGTACAKSIADAIDSADDEDMERVNSLGLSKMLKVMVGFKHFKAYLDRRIDKLFSEASKTVLAKLHDIEACAAQRRDELREELNNADPARMVNTVHACGMSFASCLNHVMEGHIRSDVKRVTLEEELREFHAYHTELGDIDTFMCIPSDYFGGLNDYIDYLRLHIRVPSAEVAINGGAQFSRLLFEVETFLRFDEIAVETKKREVMQAFGLSTGRSVTWKEVVVKLLTHSARVQLQRRIRYVGERIKWFFQQQKEPVVHFMESLKGSPDEKLYSKLYTKHASLIEDNVIIKNLVFDCYDGVVDRQLRDFLELFQSTLYAIFSNPWVFLKQDTSKFDELDRDEAMLLPSIDETKARLLRELSNRSGGERDVQDRIYEIPLEPHRIDEAVERVQCLVLRVYSRIRTRICDQVELFAESFFKLPLMRCLEEDMVKIEFSPIDEEGYRVRRDAFQARLAEAERELSEVQDGLKIVRNFTLTSIASA